MIRLTSVYSVRTLEYKSSKNMGPKKIIGTVVVSMYHRNGARVSVHT